MSLKNYEKEIAEYLDNLRKSLEELQSQIGLSDDVVVGVQQRTEDRIRRLLEINESYAIFELDIKHLEYKDKNLYSLTEMAKKKNNKNPSYVIQAWLRDVKTLELLCLWEREHNSLFDYDEANKLIAKTKDASFTLTAKKWIANTNAQGIISRQGKGGGTLAHHEIAIDFITWLFPEKRYELLKMITDRIMQ